MLRLILRGQAARVCARFASTRARLPHHQGHLHRHSGLEQPTSTPPYSTYIPSAQQRQQQRLNSSIFIGATNFLLHCRSLGVSTPIKIPHLFSVATFSTTSTAAMASEEHALLGTITAPRYQDAKEVNDMIRALEAGLKKDSKKAGVGYSCRKTGFQVPSKDMTISSWRFNDWDYKKYDLPTNARGLFTYRNSITGNHEILVRGYDKFFNIGEVSKTKWSWIKDNTVAPYEVTLKENGCIIFMSGLADGSLLVCSKHSLGKKFEGGDTEAHAIVGERWVEKHLASVGKTKEQLARALRDMNATAVAELCDDSFEEHILPYTEDQAGLYVHGINFNIPTFATCSQAEVQKFAETWGMRKTDYLELKDVDSLKKFLEDAAETGSWDGKDVEGFVIRCKARDIGSTSNWHDWFFKYKFEEPYLMYRQWREVTKAMLAKKEPKIRKHEKVTKEYLAFARTYFRENPEAAREYQLNHGIIALRNAFLEKRGATGNQLVKEEAGEGKSKPIVDAEEGDIKLVVVPIATIGCGKTTLAIALSRLFHWGHVQNDNISGKDRPPRFANAIVQGLKDYPVMIADRNNHQRRERQQIFEDVLKQAPRTRMVALHYVHYRDDIPGPEFKERIKKATSSRVFTRGDNHQTIHALSKSEKEITKIMDGFLQRFEPAEPESAPDYMFDSIIDLDVEADSRVNLETVVTQLHQQFPSLVSKMPTAEEMDEAIKFALSEYAPKSVNGPKVTKANTPASQPSPLPQAKKGSPTEYFAIQLPADKVLEAVKATMAKIDSDGSAFFNGLQQNRRVQDAFHVTLVHRASTKAKNAQSRAVSIWDRYNNLSGLKKDAEDINAGVKLDKLVWDGRIMAIAVQLLQVGKEKDWPCVNEVAHITIGTKSKEVKPKEANDMLVAWKAGAGDARSVDMTGEVVEGTFRAVPVNH